MPESIYNLEIFKGLERDIIENIITFCPLKQYNSNDTILQQWDVSNGEWYIIKHGRVSISIGNSKVAELWAWAIVWEIALLNEEERTASVTALSETEMIVLSFDNLIEMIDNDENKINKEIMRRMEENINR